MAVVLLVFLLLAIIGVTTLLVGRAMGWWTYADLPLIGRFFPAESEGDPSDPGEVTAGEDDPATVDPTVALQAELDDSKRRVSDLEALLAQREQQVSSLTAQVEDLTEQLQLQGASADNEQWKTTAKMLAAMRAEQAAAIVGNYTDDQIRSVLRLMSAEAAGGILSKLDPARAARVTAAGGQ